MPKPLWIRSPSKIHGEGIFASEFIPKNTRVGFLIDATYAIERVILIDTRSELGRYVNHQTEPNGRMEKESGTEAYYFVASQDIDAGAELTLDYNDTPEFVAKPHEIAPGPPLSRDHYKDWL